MICNSTVPSKSENYESTARNQISKQQNQICDIQYHINVLYQKRWEKKKIYNNLFIKILVEEN